MGTDHDAAATPGETGDNALTPPSNVERPTADPPHLKRRRRFNISLRTMMILVLIIGTWLGWYVRRVQIQQNAVAAIKKAGGTVVYDLEWRNGGSNPYRKSWVPEWLGGDQAWMPNWMIRGAGIDYFGNVVSARLVPSRVNDPEAASDATLALVGQLSRLQLLWLNSAPITDAGLAHLGGLAELRDLQISHTKIGDAGLANIKGLTGLTELNIANTQVTDAGLAHLRGMTNLRLLFLSGSRVTDEGVLALESALPALHVYREEEMALFGAQPRALNDLDFARSQPVRLASMLLSQRADVMASRGERAKLAATIDAVCHLEAHDQFSLLKIAVACAASVRSLDRFHGQGLSEDERRALQTRCANRGIAALAEAIELGLGIEHITSDPGSRFHPYNVRAGELEPLRGYPGFQQLVETRGGKPRER
jgi:Leucine Rich repeat